MSKDQKNQRDSAEHSASISEKYMEVDTCIGNGKWQTGHMGDPLNMDIRKRSGMVGVKPIQGHKMVVVVSMATRYFIEAD